MALEHQSSTRTESPSVKKKKRRNTNSDFTDCMSAMRSELDENCRRKLEELELRKRQIGIQERRIKVEEEERANKREIEKVH